MKLHSVQFEHSLRRRVKQAVSDSQELKREYRAAKRQARQYSSAGFFRVCLSLLLGCAVWGAVEYTQHPATALAILNLWALGSVFIRAKDLLACLFMEPDLAALSLLPIPEKTIFEWEFQKFIRRSLYSLADFIIGYGALALACDFGPGRWLLAMLLAALTWTVLLALAVIGAAYLRRTLIFFVANALTVAWVGLMIVWKILAASLLEILDRWSWHLNLLLPTGWPVSLAHGLYSGWDWRYLGLLVLIGGVCWSVRLALAQLRSGYEFVDVSYVEAPDILPESEAFDEADESDGRSAHLGETAIEEIVQSRQFLALTPWRQRGWFEEKLWLWLSEREKALCEWIFADGVSIVGPWKNAARNLLFVWVALFALKWLSASVSGWLIIIGLGVPLGQAIRLFYGTGRAFNSIACGGVSVPLYAGLAAGYRELSWLLFKYSLIQLPLLVVFSLCGGAIAAYLTDWPVWHGLLIALKLVCLLSAARCIFVALGFSSGTNDSAKFSLRSGCVLTAIIACGLTFLILAISWLLVANPVSAMICGALAMVDAFLFWRIYGWFYNTWRFDLMSIPRH
jgi:hypothetical protein